MPPAAIVAVGAYLGASGALAVAGTAIAGAIGIGTVSTVTATAIGAAAFSGTVSLAQGGSASDVLKAAVIGGVTSYAGSTIANSVSNSVTSALTAPGAEVSAISAAMGKVAGAAVAGAISSGTAALLYEKDPLQALLKGGLTAAMTSAVGLGVDAVLKDVPGFGTPDSPMQAAVQRATKAAIGTAILSGGDSGKIKSSALNAFVNTAAQQIGASIRDISGEVERARTGYSQAVDAYKWNIDSQNALVNEHNNLLSRLETERLGVNDLVKQYEDVAWKYNNHETYMRSQGWTYEPASYNYNYDYGGDIPARYVKQEWRESRPYYYTDDYGNTQLGEQGPGYVTQFLDADSEKKSLYDRAVALDAQAVAAANRYNQNLESGKAQLANYANEINKLKSELSTRENEIVNNQKSLENSIVEFQKTEAANAAQVQKKLNDFEQVADRHLEVFGVEPTEQELIGYTQGRMGQTNDILDALPRLDTLETIKSTHEEIFGEPASIDQLKNYASVRDLSSQIERLDQLGEVKTAHAKVFGQDASVKDMYDYASTADVKEWLPKLENLGDAKGQYQRATGEELTFDELKEYFAAENLTQTLAKDLVEFDELAEAKAAGFNTVEEHEISKRYEAIHGKPPTPEQLAQFVADKSIYGDIGQTVYSDDPDAWKKAGFKNAQDFADWKTYVTNQEAAAQAGFVTYEDYVDSFGERPEDFYAKKEGWDSYEDKRLYAARGVTDPKLKPTALDVTGQPIADGFGSNFALDQDAKAQGWVSANQREIAAAEGITDPDTWKEMEYLRLTPERTKLDGDMPGWEWDSETGTYTRVFDDGSSITVDPDGNIVNVAEATDTPFIPEITRRNRTTGTGTGGTFRFPLQMDQEQGGNRTYSMTGRVPGLAAAAGMGSQILPGMPSAMPGVESSTSNYQPLISPLGITAEKSPEYWMGGTGRMTQFIDPLSSGRQGVEIDPIPDMMPEDRKNNIKDPSKNVLTLPGASSEGDEDEEGNPMDYYSYGNPSEPGDVLRPFSKYAQGGQVMPSPLMAASGGDVSHKGSHYVQGAGGGQDDLIDAKLADGEYVFDADIVAALGDGSNKRGAEILDKFREQIRKHKRSAPAGKIPPAAKSPLAYLKEVTK